MNQTSTTVGGLRVLDEINSTRTTVENKTLVQAVLDAIHDEDCQRILELTSDEVLSAKEISNRCELPLSTTYRKLKLLSETNLLEERTRIRESGKHTSEYARLVGDIHVSLDISGRMNLRLVARETTGPANLSLPMD